MENTKQVIVVRKDLKMRKGKIGSQCAHASMAFLTRCGIVTHMIGPKFVSRLEELHQYEVRDWLEGSFRKIVLYVNSEAELDEIHQKALDFGLVSHMVVDAGLTEFNGVPTKTCLCIGPHVDERIDLVTSHLPLL